MAMTQRDRLQRLALRGGAALREGRLHPGQRDHFNDDNRRCATDTYVIEAYNASGSTYSDLQNIVTLKVTQARACAAPADPDPLRGYRRLHGPERHSALSIFNGITLPGLHR